MTCNEYYKDMLEFKKILETKTTKEEAIKYLKNNSVKYDSIQKGTEYIISFNSFVMTFGEDGKLKSSEEN